ncbi:prepilin peptidase [Streptobacillus felis]|uniref:Prepilin peptidase n=1 Tax=Streptobacillus felis TaxID=1384509 RepID=A0A7Z0TCC7_9FUSO|nr:prepilin peptidase [Streptobacillus felis]NYV28283.1 prepilin peptidase [Streptobacillus felis]
MRYFIYLLLVYISYLDLKETYIYDRDLLILFLLIFFSTKEGMYSSYLGMGIFSIPFFILLIIEYHIKYELIGLGDVKLIIIFGIYFGYRDAYFLLSFYQVMFLSSLIYGLILRKRYVPFAPAMCLSFVFHDVMYV